MTVDIRIPRTQPRDEQKRHCRDTIECSCYRANLNVELMPDHHTPETHLLAECLKMSLQKAVEELPVMEQNVLAMHWGIGHEEPMDFQEISLRIGGSEQGAKHIFRSGMRKLRKNMFKSKIFERSDKLLLTEAVCAEL